jgi:large repetitive protein
MPTRARPRRRTRRGGGRTRVAGVVLAALVASGPALPAPAATSASGAAGPRSFSSDPSPTWGTSPSDNPGDAGSDRAGKVLAVAEVGDRVFLAGEFTGLMPPGASTNKARQDPTPIVPRRYLAALDVKTGALLDWDAQVDGPVMALAVSPDGRRLYLGGTFRRVGSAAQTRLAAVDVATGATDPTFQPPSPNAYVRALALSGDTLFVGGAFVSVGTEPRSQLVAVDATTGALRDDWVPPENTGGHFTGHTGAAATDDGSHGQVHDLKVTRDGTMLLVGGSFLDWAGHKGLMALDTETAQPTSWQPALDQGRPVYGLDIFPADGRTIFVAAGGSGGTIEAFRPDAGRKPLWVHRVDGDATDVAATASRLYLVGHYDYVLGKNTTCGSGSCTGGNDGDVVNHHISAFDPVTGAHDLSFTAQFNTPQGPEVAVLGADHLYVGGNFTKVNDLPHPGFVQFAAAAN